MYVPEARFIIIILIVIKKINNNNNNNNNNIILFIIIIICDLAVTSECYLNIQISDSSVYEMACRLQSCVRGILLG